MEAAPGASAAMRNGGVTLPPMASSSSFDPSREEWRVVSEQSELERSNLDQSDERLIYEQRLHNLAKQREDLQNMELALRAQAAAQSEIVRLQNTFDAQTKEHANANVKLQEQLHEKEQKIHELERRTDEKERELHAIRLNNEAVWAKEDLLREQSKELQSYRRERDNTEAERAQHIKQIHDLQEHIQEKERQFIELQEQHRIAQETILFKDEQIRETQTWITHAQEIDALQTNTNHTLQAELRERTEQYNQLWLACQRQFGEMERLHLHIQQLQHEMSDAREKSGSQSDGSLVSHTNSNDASRLEHANGIQLEVNDRNSPTANAGSLENGNSGTSGGSALTQSDQVHGVAFTPSSLFRMPAYLPNTLHPFLMHQHGVPHPSHVTQSPFQSVPAMSSVQNWQSQQSLSEGEHVPAHNQYPDLNMSRTDSHYEHEASAVNEHIHHTDYVDANVNQRLASDSVVPPLSGEIEVHDSMDASHDKAQSQLNMQQISSQFHEALRVGSFELGNDTKEEVTGHGEDVRNAMMEQSAIAIDASSGQTRANLRETTSDTALSDTSTNDFVSMGQKSNTGGKAVESYLLDERALLASVARAIGSGGRTRISSTLPNRLGKMLAPLHWHDYKKKYGKLDDFVASHPDLFLIEGDYIQLREGAQKIIASAATAAKVAAVVAAAAAPSSFSSSMPSVAVTPMANSHRLKKFSAMQSQNLNGSTFQVARGVSNVKILSNSNYHGEPTGSVTMPGRSAMLTVGNEMTPDRIDIPQSKVSSHGRPGMSAVGQKHNRTTGAASTPRR